MRQNKNKWKTNPVIIDKSLEDMQKFIKKKPCPKGDLECLLEKQIKGAAITILTDFSEAYANNQFSTINFSGDYCSKISDEVLRFGMGNGILPKKTYGERGSRVRLILNNSQNGLDYQVNTTKYFN